MEPKNELAGTSKPPDSCEAVVRKWVVVFGENCSKEVSPALVNVWIEAFRGVEPRALEAAFRRTLLSWRITQIPPIGEIMSHIETAKGIRKDLDAENAWQEALDYAGDLGNDYRIESAQEPDDEAIMAGVRAAGGWHWISQCSEEQLVWAKKNFLEIYAKHKDLPEIMMLTEGGCGPEVIHPAV